MHKHEQDPIKAAIVTAKNTGALVLDDFVLLTLPDIVYNAETITENTSSWYTSEVIRRLSCRNCGIKSISEDLSCLESLEVIDLTGNQLTHFPANVELPLLKNLNLTRNMLKNIDSRCLAEVTELQVPENRLEAVYFDNLSPNGALVKLNLAKNRIKDFYPPSTYNYSLLYLDLSYNHLTEFDCAAFPNLEVLVLHHNRLHDIKNLSSLKKLRILDLSYNSIQNDPHGYELSTITGDLELLHDLRNKMILSNLQEINLSYNSLQSVPSFLFSCPGLISMDLSSNNIQRADGRVIWEFHGVSKLESIDLTANDMQELPPELGTLKRLNRLRFDGNPMRRMRQIAGDNSCAKVLEYLRGKIPHDHPYYQSDKDSLSKQTRNKVAGQLRAMAEAQLEMEYMVLPNSAVVARNVAGSLSGCKLEFIDVHNIEDIPLATLQTANPSLKALSSITFRNCTCLNQNILQSIINNLNFDTAPSLRAIEISCIKRVPIRELVIYRSSVTNIIIKQIPSLIKIEILDSPFLTDIVIEESGMEDLSLSNVASLRSLSLKSNRISVIPESILSPTLNIEELYLNDNSISVIPIDILNMKALQTLDLSYNLFKKLPNEISLLAPANEHEQSWTKQYAGNLTKLGLAGVYLTYFPKSVVNRGALSMMRYMRESINPDELEQVLSVRKKLDHAFNSMVKQERANSRQSGAENQRGRTSASIVTADRIPVEDAEQHDKENDIYNPYHATNETMVEMERARSRGSSQQGSRACRRPREDMNPVVAVPAPIQQRRGRVTQSSIQFGDANDNVIDYGRVGSIEKLKTPSQPRLAQPPRDDYERPAAPSRGHIQTNARTQDTEKPARRHYLSSQGFW